MTLSGFKKKISDITSRHVTTLRQRIFLMTVPVLILTSIIYMFEAVKTERSIMRDELIKKAEVVTELATYSGELPLISENPELIQKEILSLKSISEVSFVAFYDKNMELIIKDGDIFQQPLRFNEKSSMYIKEEDDYFDLSAPVFTVKAGEDIDIFQETDMSKETREIVGWVRIGFSKAAMKEAEKNIIYRGMIIAIILIIGSSVLIYNLTAAATKPLALLSKAVESIRKGKYPEINITSSDEIGTLTTEFNRMSRTIREREEMLVNRASLSAFVADIGMVLTESGTLQDILQQCAEIVMVRLDALISRIWIYKKEDNILEVISHASKHSLKQPLHTRIQVGEFEAGTIALNRRSHYSNHIDSLHSDDRKWAIEQGIVSFADYPLIVENQLVGVIEIFAERHLSEDVFRTMETVADEIALGIQHKLVEQQIKTSLDEKEVLLREIHHRVKNNMQVISSMLSLQSDQVKDKPYVDILNDSKNRIKSMALVHEKLYKSKDMANIDFKDYIMTLANSLFSFYETSARNVSLKINIENATLGVDTAIPCGLIINELISNCLKHAFPENRKGELNLTLKTTGIKEETIYDLIVSDNGIGLPESLDIREAKSLGLQLVTTLVEHQLQGNLDINRTEGTGFHIRFKEIKYTKRI